MLTRYAEVAIAFASALVDGDFAHAESLLAPDLRLEYPSETLREKFASMFRGYALGEPRSVHFEDEFQMENWPAKQPGDIGWAYVGIDGDDFVEAVAVVVADVDGKHLIRELEWGRP